MFLLYECGDAEQGSFTAKKNNNYCFENVLKSTYFTMKHC